MHANGGMKPMTSHLMFAPRDVLLARPDDVQQLRVKFACDHLHVQESGQQLPGRISAKLLDWNDCPQHNVGLELQLHTMLCNSVSC